VAAFFLDTSTVLKRYVQETGTAWVQALAAPSALNSLFVVRVTLAESIAAITRRERGGSITSRCIGKCRFVMPTEGDFTAIDRAINH
jgi:uncharacterized protein